MRLMRLALAAAHRLVHNQCRRFHPPPAYSACIHITPSIKLAVSFVAGAAAEPRPTPARSLNISAAAINNETFSFVWVPRVTWLVSSPWFSRAGERPRAVPRPGAPGGGAEGKAGERYWRQVRANACVMRVITKMSYHASMNGDYLNVFGLRQSSCRILEIIRKPLNAKQ